MRRYIIRYLLVLVVIAVIGCGVDAATAPPQAGPPDSVELITPVTPLPTSTAAADHTGAVARLKALYEVSIEVEWDPVTREVRFTARILGGPDVFPELICTTTDWNFGDEFSVRVVPGCIPDRDEFPIQREFHIEHSYEKAGLYEIRFSRGELAADPVLLVVGGTD